MQNRADIRFHGAAETVGAPAHIVVANILAHPLIVLAPALARLTREHGQLALAGVLASQAVEVCAAYRPWVEIGVDDEEDGWVLLAGTRRSDEPA
jgi:ribosomal protein L11 methyltransferase